MDLTLLPWHWIVFGIILIISEVFLASFFIIWFGIAALAVGIALYITPTLDPMWQVLLWAITSSLLAFGWFKTFKAKAGFNGKHNITQQDIQGEIGIVLTPPIGNKKGRLRFPAPVLGIDEWEIQCDIELDIGDRVEAIDISDHVLLVKKH
jgi:membrane protein implicated in regulation of membrane protease activity